MDDKKTMPDLTEEGYDALDELWTQTTLRVGPNGNGFISRRKVRMMELNDLSIDYLYTGAIASHKSPAEIIGELVRKEIAASAHYL
jgi:hypothetical protein